MQLDLNRIVQSRNIIGPDVDANSLTIPGIYRLSGVITNFPEKYGILIVFSSNGATAQMLIRQNTYTRLFWTDWSEWTQL